LTLTSATVVKENLYVGVAALMTIAMQWRNVKLLQI